MTNEELKEFSWDIESADDHQIQSKNISHAETNLPSLERNFPSVIKDSFNLNS